MRRRRFAEVGGIAINAAETTGSHLGSRGTGKAYVELSRGNGADHVLIPMENVLEIAIELARIHEEHKARGTAQLVRQEYVDENGKKRAEMTTLPAPKGRCLHGRYLGDGCKDCEERLRLGGTFAASEIGDAVRVNIAGRGGGKTAALDNACGSGGGRSVVVSASEYEALAKHPDMQINPFADEEEPDGTR
jgi:hypothetical protein